MVFFPFVDNKKTSDIQVMTTDAHPKNENFFNFFFSSTYKHSQRAADSSISYFILFKIKDKKPKLTKAGNITTANY